MASLTLVGDELRLDGETVATLLPHLSARNSLRGRLEQAIADAEREDFYDGPDEAAAEIQLIKGSLRAVKREEGALIKLRDDAYTAGHYDLSQRIGDVARSIKVATAA